MLVCRDCGDVESASRADNTTHILKFPDKMTAMKVLTAIILNALYGWPGRNGNDTRLVLCNEFPNVYHAPCEASIHGRGHHAVGEVLVRNVRKAQPGSIFQLWARRISFKGCGKPFSVLNSNKLVVGPG